MKLVKTSSILKSNKLFIRLTSHLKLSHLLKNDSSTVDQQTWDSASTFPLYHNINSICSSQSSSLYLDLTYIFCHYDMELGSKLTWWGNIQTCLSQGPCNVLLSLLEVDTTKRRNSGSQYGLPACYRSRLSTRYFKDKKPLTSRLRIHLCTCWKT